MALSAEQRANIRRSLAVARHRGASPRETKALLLAAAVESNYRHLPHGDRDSVGILQHRPSQGWGPATESVETDVAQFLRRARQANTGGGSAGQLAQAVQRSAFGERYDQRSKEVEQLLRTQGGSTAKTTRLPAETKTRTVTTPGVDNSGSRRQLLANYLLNERDKPGSLVALKAGLGENADVPGTSKTVTESVPGAPRSSGGGGGGVEKLAQRADTIDRKRLPYKWGGGHGGKVDPRTAKPLDCSGAVSAVLGINPRVSGQFERWGKPGTGSGKGVVIYANAEHVLMSINGRFFGTSKSNPGGGAGWIPRSQVSREYLSRFTARHLERGGSGR